MPEVLSDQCFSAKRVAEVSQKLTEDLSVSQKEVTYALFENEPIQPEAVETEKEETRNLVIAKEVTTSSPPPKMQIVWRNVAIMAILHGLAIYGLSQVHLIKWQTFYFTFVVAVLNSLGVQAGAHRLWAHRSYKANFGVRLFLSLCHVLALQNDLYEWCRDHRGHHKFSDTRADPHNSNRGFFFSHVGWLLCKKDPEVLRRGKTLDLSDLEADPIVMFQRKFYIPMIIIFWGFLPTFIPVHFWGEGVWNAFLATVIVRYVYALNVTWCVNSWAHLYGNRPYDKKIAPVEATIRHLLMGEGFHNVSICREVSRNLEEGFWIVFLLNQFLLDFLVSSRLSLGLLC